MDINNYQNNLSKLWNQYAPFYLDYLEEKQFGDKILQFQWIKGKQDFDDRWNKFELLVQFQNMDKYYFECLDVLFPKDDAEFDPDELINNSG